MSIIEQFKQGKITKEQLAQAMQDNPELKEQAQALLDGELGLDDLEGVVGGVHACTTPFPGSNGPGNQEGDTVSVSLDMW